MRFADILSVAAHGGGGSPELLVNGNFTSDASGWTSHDASATIASVGGEGVVTQISGAVGRVREVITTAIGTTYNVVWTKATGYLQKGDDADVSVNVVTFVAAGAPTGTTSFVATATSTTISLATFSTDTFDGLSVKRA